MVPTDGWDDTGGSGLQLTNPWSMTKDVTGQLDFDPEWMESRMAKLTQLVLKQEQTDHLGSVSGQSGLPLCSLRLAGDGTSVVRCGDQVETHEGGDTGADNLFIEALDVQAIVNLLAPG